MTSALLLGTLIGTLLIPIIFYTYSGIIGRTYMVLDIATFIMSVLAAFIIVYKAAFSCKMESCSFEIGVMVVIVAIGFIVFTYSPPEIGLFISPT